MHKVQVKGILSAKNGMNLYRGCQHGCIYCDSRSSCYQMHHDFEDIEVKENALELLEDALRRKCKPWINDTPENIRAIVEACAGVGVRGMICFGMGLTLRQGSREYFYRQLDRLFPGMKEKYIRRYGDAYMLDSPRSRELMALFHSLCAEHGILHNNDTVFAWMSAFEEKRPAQLSLFDPM